MISFLIKLAMIILKLIILGAQEQNFLSYLLKIKIERTHPRPTEVESQWLDLGSKLGKF